MSKVKPDGRYYYKNGQVKSEYYRLNGLLHREDGPAVIRYDKNGQIESQSYWINGEEIMDEFQIFVIEGLGMSCE